jgi:hypothetical protein
MRIEGISRFVDSLRAGQGNANECTYVGCTQNAIGVSSTRRCDEAADCRDEAQEFERSDPFAVQQAAGAVQKVESQREEIGSHPIWDESRN